MPIGPSNIGPTQPTLPPGQFPYGPFGNLSTLQQVLQRLNLGATQYGPTEAARLPIPQSIMMTPAQRAAQSGLGPGAAAGFNNGGSVIQNMLLSGSAAAAQRPLPTLAVSAGPVVRAPVGFVKPLGATAGVPGGGGAASGIGPSPGTSPSVSFAGGPFSPKTGLQGMQAPTFTANLGTAVVPGMLARGGGVGAVGGAGDEGSGGSAAGFGGSGGGGGDTFGEHTGRGGGYEF